ncbi:Ribosomal protein S1 [Macleaya cordata]|uniref:Ribosomal protein S1 n=1 Tax=Macleaya cordata TaxID=56857 RepID=A0A200QY31_MACCD|nr:Ribosomal protein S1 [Macleaya cordata]
MQTLLNPHLLLFPPPKTLIKPSKLQNPTYSPNLSWRIPLLSGFRPLSDNFTVKAFTSDEFPVDETFLEKFGPKDKESEDEARKRNWIERGWAPWEEILSPEADFARKSLNEGEEVPLQSPEAIEAFKMLSPNYRKKKIEESGLTEDEYLAKQFEIKGEILEPLETTWDGPLVLRMLPPRDWPPRGWEVDEKELAFIREAHKLQSVRVDLEDFEANKDTDNLSIERFNMFLKQYKEWVAENKDRLEEESYKHDQDYYPGRRKRGKDYKDDMLELPFFYPGQICTGKVTTLHLYQGAFVDIGGVYDGWVPIKGNDWYWIRQHIKVGMDVIVEILAKRDPYRFRFPIEMRFVSPNIDHLIFNRFEFPPIFHRDEDTNPDELRRDCGRPPIPRKDPGIKEEEQPLLSNHPYVDKLWQLHVAEQMILDDEEANPDKYKDKELAHLNEDADVDAEDTVEYSQAYYKKTLLPKMILKTNTKELDLDAARAERQLNNKLRREAKERGEEFKVTKLRRNIEMDEYDLIHWRRSFEEREALIRDTSCRQTLGLPLQEPGRYVDNSYFGKDQYDPSSPLYRYDYWGEPKNSEKSKQERMTDAHNKSIVGKGNVWYEMSYEDAIKQRMEREARSKKQPLVNGTESSRLSDEGVTLPLRNLALLLRTTLWRSRSEGSDQGQEGTNTSARRGGATLGRGWGLYFGFPLSKYCDSTQLHAACANYVAEWFKPADV